MREMVSSEMVSSEMVSSEMVSSEMVSSEMVSGEVTDEALVGIRKLTVCPLTTHHSPSHA